MVISFAIGTPITVFQIIGAVFVILGVITASGLVVIQKRNTKKKYLMVVNLPPLKWRASFWLLKAVVRIPCGIFIRTTPITNQKRFRIDGKAVSRRLSVKGLLLSPRGSYDYLK